MTDQTKQTKTITYTAPRNVEIGDVFYKVDSVDHCHFYEPCKACGGVGKLTVNDITFNCPVCNTGKRSLSISKYCVRRYRVYRFTDEVSTADWAAATHHKVIIRLYRKVGHGYVCTFGAQGGEFEIDTNEFAKYLNASYETVAGQTHPVGIYDNYALALSVADKLNDAELEKLNVYNTERGTAHVAKFNNKITNDPKSK